MLLWVFAAITSIMLYHNFSLSLQADTLRAQAGLGLRVDKKTPLHRIQLIRLVRNVRHRFFGYQSIYYDSSAANRGTNESLFEGTFGKWLIPLITNFKVNETCSILMPTVKFEHSDWQRIDIRAWKRRFKRNLIYWLPIVYMCLVISVWALLLFIPLTIWNWYVSRKYVQSIAYTCDSHAVHVKKGWWVNTLTVIPFEKIQGISDRESFFDRQNHMRSVRIDVAAHSSRRFACEIPYLDSTKASEFMGFLASQAEKRRFEW